MPHPTPFRAGFAAACAAGLALGLFAAGCGPSPTTPDPPGPGAAPGVERPAGPPLFQDVTARSGIDFTYRNGEETGEHLTLLESLGGGVGLIDYDGDGLLDVFFPGGGTFTGADKKTIVGLPCKLYRNLGDLKFRDATAEAGLDKLAGGAPWFYSHGVAVGDYDRDGWPDLLVTGWGRVALLHNEPDGKGGRKFADASAAAGLGRGVAWATSAAFADLDGDGYPDLYVCQYVDWSWAKHPTCNYDGRTRDVCPPRQFDGLPQKLYRNTGKGRFQDVSEEAGLLPGGPNRSKGLGVLIVDVDGDGKPDVYVANDTVDNYLYLNKSRPGAIRLQERGLDSGAARDDRGNANGSMGLDAGDPERSGKPTLWVTNYENELHALYQNLSTPGRPFFNFHSTAMGIGAIGQKYVGWGTAFLDADLDGWEDLFVAHGHAIRYPTGRAASRREQPVLLLNEGGKRFREASRQLGGYSTAPRLGRGVGFGDLDNDGRTDMIISHVNEPAAVLRGVGGADNHWVGVRLEGAGRACTVGARAVWEDKGGRQTRFAKGGGSYASSGDRRLLFGLAGEQAGRLTVTWPDGSEEKFDNLAADHYYRVVQGSGKAEALPGGVK